MASAFGKSWGAAFGNAWGAIEAVLPPIVEYPPTSGGYSRAPNRGRKVSPPIEVFRSKHEREEESFIAIFNLV